MGSYVDIDEILAGDERIKCTFTTDALDCGYLDPSCRGPDLQEGTGVELPLWLATPLATRGDVNVEVPHFLTKRFRRMLKAGPSSVNLREFSAYMYEIGKQLMPLVKPADQEEIDEIMRLSFGGERYRDILNNSMSSLDEDTTEFTRKLTQDEKKLFNAGARDAKDFIQWKGRNAETITTAAVVERSLKKRNRRYQHHFMLLSCGRDGRPRGGGKSADASYNGRVRVGWDQSTNKEAFLRELKNLRATDLSDVGAALKQAFELMNQIRLQFNWDSYALGRAPWNTNVSVCVLLTDATMLSSADGLIQDALTIAPSSAVGAELTYEPYRWDQRLFTVALKLPATMNGSKGQTAVPTNLVALSEATGGMLYMPTSKPAVEQSIDQIILKLKAGAVIKFRILTE
ncbi:hypothetical protein BBO99_00003820 [Phytophthora kernoviae]|uniref:Uncharacterized protein n=2 Tax=Phytophthora kernoviae TaxID=325452 RepID=A0A3R7J108_9STRA|nr:hypothetical protein G195_004250 [Phytophthora kernoviae 00238/432]KAG2527604.1 hypothetical protein JM16_003360 [Phytophthora kernoviae]KAG2528880.1 hypothetical protein JM18_003100 [Phytophthora kernoviae]RLN02890.1 hypothetical protein BBI17_003860 [Phytophthora kernoviae]RLN81314.1 hypothetical protein BBO99_00003820 [Phytophthora kernoviae]